jgi:dienelactone hydrolase
MKKALWLIVSLSVYPGLQTARSKATTITTTYQSYNPTTGNFDLTQSIAYQLPNSTKFGPGPYPVFIYAPGTYETYTDPLAMEFVASMAARGFLAATVQYNNNETVQTCSNYTPRAQGIYDVNRSTSAAGVLCSLSHANCSKGIVTSGISQGGFMVVLAANYNPNVKAVYALSMSDFAQNENLSYPCVDKQNTVIPANRLTIVNGAADPFFGGQQPLENVSGYTCANGSQQCWSPDGAGAGWYIVQNSQNKNGISGHCYFLDVSGNNPTACFGVGDPSWLPPAAYNWSLNPNLDWLATFGTHRNFSSNGQ